jgi:hypothetical protein
MPPVRPVQVTVEVIGEVAGFMVGEMVTVAVGTGVGVALFIAYRMTTTPPEVTSAELLNAAVIEKGPVGSPVPEVDVEVIWMGFMMFVLTVVE